MFVFQRFANTERKKKIHPFRYIDNALLYRVVCLSLFIYRGCLLLVFALLYGLPFKKRKQFHASSAQKPNFMLL